MKKSFRHIISLQDGSFENTAGAKHPAKGVHTLWALLSLCFLCSSFINAQDMQSEEAQYQQTVVKGDMHIQVAFDKTLFLVFPEEVLSVDRGNRDLLAQKDQAALNILKVKSNTRNFRPTNLHVVTAAGKLYSFEVSFREQLPLNTIDMGQFQPASGKQARFGFAHDVADFRESVSYILGRPLTKIRKSARNGALVYFFGAYQKDRVIYLHLGIENFKSLPMDMGEPEFLIRDKKLPKRTSVREEKMTAKHEYFSGGRMQGRIPAKHLVFAFSQFGIAEGKYLEILLPEKNGDRKLQLKIKGKDLLNAAPIPFVQP